MLATKAEEKRGKGSVLATKAEETHKANTQGKRSGLTVAFNVPCTSLGCGASTSTGSASIPAASTSCWSSFWLLYLRTKGAALEQESPPFVAVLLWVGDKCSGCCSCARTVAPQEKAGCVL